MDSQSKDTAGQELARNRRTFCSQEKGAFTDVLELETASAL